MWLWDSDFTQKCMPTFQHIGALAFSFFSSVFSRFDLISFAVCFNLPLTQSIPSAVLCCMYQVLAFFLRPHENSKHRKKWNLYHSWVGRIALFFGALNIVLGIHYAEAGDEWQIGYGFLLGSTLLACIVLETLLRMKKLNNPAYRPDFPMNSME